MNLPYYFSDTSNSSQPKSNLFQKAKEKLSGINSSYQTPPTTLLNEYLNLSIHNYNQKTTDIPKITINSCLNYPSSREYQSKYLEIPNSITQCFDGFVKKSDQINRQDIQSDIIMNRMQLNEFLYQPNSHSKNISQSDYSNVKEYKFSSMVVNRNKSPFFSPIDKSGEVSEFFQKEESRIENKIFLEKSGPIVEKTTKNARFDLKSFSPPKKYNCENNSFIEEFPLDELGRSLSSSKKKKKIFDTANITQLNDKTKNIHHFFPDKIKEFLLRANDKNLRVFFPNNEDFLKKYKILDKDGENKSKIYLKHAFLEESAILFENFEVKIGLKSSLTQTEPNRDNGLLIFLYYCNKNKGDLKNCLLKFSASKSTY